MAEQSTTANKRSNVVPRRTLPALTAALTVWALVSSFFALDVTDMDLSPASGVWSCPCRARPPRRCAI